MNKILIILSLVLLVSCSSKEIPYENLVVRQGVHYEVNSQTPFTGVSVEYHENGQLNNRTSYKDGKKDGLVEDYYENGKLNNRTSYKDGKKDGLVEDYYENGQLNNRTSYKDGKKDGVDEQYYENGQLRLKGNYKDDKIEDGSFEEYNENGQLIPSGGTFGGIRLYGNGLYESYGDNGQLEVKVNYKGGEKHGLHEVYLRSGRSYKFCYKNGKETDMSYCEK